MNTLRTRRNWGRFIDIREWHGRSDSGASGWRDRAATASLFPDCQSAGADVCGGVRYGHVGGGGAGLVAGGSQVNAQLPASLPAGTNPVAVPVVLIVPPAFSGRCRSVWRTEVRRWMLNLAPTGRLVGQ